VLHATPSLCFGVQALAEQYELSVHCASVEQGVEHTPPTQLPLAHMVLTWHVAPSTSQATVMAIVVELDLSPPKLPPPSTEMPHPLRVTVELHVAATDGV